MRRFIITISILILAIIINYFPSSPEPVLTRLSLKQFPAEIGDWVLVREQQIDDSSMAVLQVDDYTMRTYSNREGQTVTLYIGYFKTQKKRERPIILPGSAFQGPAGL